MQKSKKCGGGIVFVLTGPSGSGKTTLASQLLKTKGIARCFARSVSFTTRKPRVGEADGRDYFFVTESRFRSLLRKKKILEWTRYLGYYYGTPREFVQERLAEGKSLIFCLDRKGALRLKRVFGKSSRTIFIKPPSLEALRERIRKRSHLTQREEIARRLAVAVKEMRFAASYDYCVTNANLRDAVARIRAIVTKELEGAGRGIYGICTIRKTN
jgi:guanylate kinase